MTLSKYVGVMAGGLVLTGAATAQDYQAEIAELRAQLAELKSQNGDKWLTEERAAEIKSLVKDVLADAETRTSLQGAGATSGYDNGFFIGSADGNFRLKFNALEQIRFTYNSRNSAQDGNQNATVFGQPNNEWGFENRRTQLTFSGNVVDPSFTYMARFNYGSTGDPYNPPVMVQTTTGNLNQFGIQSTIQAGTSANMNGITSTVNAGTTANMNGITSSGNNTIDVTSTPGQNANINAGTTANMDGITSTINAGAVAQTTGLNVNNGSVTVGPLTINNPVTGQFTGGTVTGTIDPGAIVTGTITTPATVAGTASGGIVTGTAGGDPLVGGSITTPANINGTASGGVVTSTVTGTVSTNLTGQFFNANIGGTTSSQNIVLPNGTVTGPDAPVTGTTTTNPGQTAAVTGTVDVGNIVSTGNNAIAVTTNAGQTAAVTGTAITQANVVVTNVTTVTTADYGMSPGLVLQDAWFNKDFGSGISVKAGQFKTPFMAESLRNDGDQLTAERSTIDYIFSAGYQQGIMAMYSADMFRVMGSYANGPRGQNQNWSTGTTSFNFAARGEFKVAGNWNEFSSESASKSDETGMMIGAAIMYYNNRGEANNPYNPAVGNVAYAASGQTSGNLYWTVDTTFKWSGLSVFAAFVGQNFDPTDAGAPIYGTGSENQYGVVAQVGYRVTDAIEAFGRYEWYDIVDSTSGAVNNQAQRDVNNILTFGVNVYAMSNVKWTTQVGISLGNMQSIDGIPGSNAMTGAGWRDNLGTAGDDETQFNVISQLQVSF